MSHACQQPLEVREPRQSQALAPMFLRLLIWVLESQVVVVHDHRDFLKKSSAAGSVTGTLISFWGPIMCFPQWIGGLIFGLLGCRPAAAIFAARMAAMCVVRTLDQKIPCTRGLGVCHLVTFPPVLWWLLTRTPNTTTGVDAYAEKFLSFQVYVIGLCLFLDARDLMFHCCGYPFPCYIREGVQAGLLDIKDPRAKRPVTLSARLIGP
ncbi:unnamed protein product [Effrenium voratum]|nr:unnamed protein product [Effrenium voratum]